MAAPANGARTQARIWLVIDGHLVPIVQPRRGRRWWRRSVPPATPVDALVAMDEPTDHWIADLATLDTALDLFANLANEPVQPALIAATRSAAEATAPRGITIHVDVPAGAPR